jgi:hypothetical protein
MKFANHRWFTYESEFSYRFFTVFFFLNSVQYQSSISRKSRNTNDRVNPEDHLSHSLNWCPFRIGWLVQWNPPLNNLILVCQWWKMVCQTKTYGSPYGHHCYSCSDPKTSSKSSKSVSPKNRGCPLCPPWLMVDVVGDVIWWNRGIFHYQSFPILQM